MFFWRQATRIELGFVQPDKPTQNTFVKSLNGKFRNECLNQHWFRSLDDARTQVDAWRYQYNHVRPHSSLNYLTPIVLQNRQLKSWGLIERLALRWGKGQGQRP